jgi:hypothetical protein
MKNCRIHLYVEDGKQAPGRYTCAECGARIWSDLRPLRFGAHKALGRVITMSDDDYNEWADLAHGAREERLEA